MELMSITKEIMDTAHRLQNASKEIFHFGCVDSGEEIPSNISNLEVKLTCGEGSARGTWCQNSKMHPPFL